MKMLNLISYSSLFISTICYAGEHGHGLGSHEHGTINIEMAVEGKTAEIDIDGPAESFLGFEYAPKTSKEKKIFLDIQTQWTKNLESIIAFDKDLNCKVVESSFEQEVEAKTESKTKELDKKESGSHSDIEAKAKITCAENIAGSNLTVSLKNVFKNIKKLKIDIVGPVTKSVEITQKVQTFKI